MAKAILEFDLTDPDDRIEHLRAIKSLDMALVLWELFYNSKKQFINELEANEDSSEKEFELVEKIWDRIYEIANERGIRIDDLIV